jgi:lactam utilization protein B
VVQAGNETYLKKIKNNQNIRFLREVFADRAYNGMQIIPRNEQNSVLNNANDIVKQYWQFTQEKSFKIDTICFHSDNKASVKALIKLKKCIK